MNEAHLRFLASPEWAQLLQTDLLPWLQAAGDLGDEVLEIGPGPGLTTDLLRQRVPKVTAVEADRQLARSLHDRLIGSNVTVVCADATRVPLPSVRFSAATCFSVLHHLPSPQQQDRLFAAVHRMLRPDGIFVGVDSLDLELIRAGHQDDTFVPVDPNALPGRLAVAGFRRTVVDVGDYQFRFLTSKPAARPPAGTPSSGERSSRRHPAGVG